MSLLGVFNSSSNAMIAQSSALSVVSQNIANMNTTGYKGVNALFQTMLSESAPATGTASQQGFYSVNEVTQNLNDVQGQIQTTGNTYDLAINGDGFFIVGANQVAPPTTGSSAATTTSSLPNLYTRAGDFTTRNTSSDPGTLQQSTLVTTSGNPVLGYQYDTSTTPPTLGSALVPVVATSEAMTPDPADKTVGIPKLGYGVATSTISVAGNVDATQPGTAQSLDIPIIDSQFNNQSLLLNWTPVTPNSWRLSIPDATFASSLKAADVTALATAQTNQTTANSAYSTAFVAAGAVLPNAGVTTALTNSTKADTVLLSAIKAAGGDTTTTLAVAQTAQSTANTAYDNAFVAAGAVLPNAGVTAALAARTTADTALLTAISAAEGDTTAAGVTTAITNKTTADAAYQAALVTAGAVLPNAGVTTAIASKTAADGTVQTAAGYADAVTNKTTADTAYKAALVAAGAVLPNAGVTTAIANKTTADSAVQAAAATADNMSSIPVSFGSSGSIVSPTSITGKVAWPSSITDTGATNSLSIDLSQLTQFAAPSMVKTFAQNGYQQGYFQSSSFDSTGTLSYNYSNGLILPAYQLPLATFAAPDSLNSLSGTMFAQTSGSGAPSVAPVGTNGTSSLQPGAVERSNIDINSQFSTMLITQQAYSMAQTAYKTADEMTQSTTDLLR